MELPPDLAVTAHYGLSVLAVKKRSHEPAMQFAMFVMSPEAQKLISRYGFSTVTEARAEF